MAREDSFMCSASHRGAVRQLQWGLRLRWWAFKGARVHPGKRSRAP